MGPGVEWWLAAATSVCCGQASSGVAPVARELLNILYQLLYFNWDKYIEVQFEEEVVIVFFFQISCVNQNVRNDVKFFMMYNYFLYILSNC